MPIGYPGNSITKEARAKAGGGFESAIDVAPVEPGINASGTVAHGEILTITDSEARFGTRTNVKPLFVNLGGSKAGSSLGRDTGDYFNAGASVVADKSLGSISQPVKYAAVVGGSESEYFGGLIFNSGGSTDPIIAYTDRYYDFLRNPAGTSSDPGFEGTLNLKHFRVWREGTRPPDALSVYFNNDDGTGTVQFYPEQPDVSLQPDPLARYYGDTRPFEGRAWQSDEIIVKQASGIDVADGRLVHFTDGQPANNWKALWITRPSDFPYPYEKVFLDQISNGVGVESAIYYAYICIDTEYNGVYVGNASTRAACTKLVRQPQTAWSPSEVAIHLVESHVPVSGSYLYFRTGIESWVSDNGVQI